MKTLILTVPLTVLLLSGCTTVDIQLMESDNNQIDVSVTRDSTRAQDANPAEK